MIETTQPRLHPLINILSMLLSSQVLKNIGPKIFKGQYPEKLHAVNNNAQIIVL